MFVRKIFLPLFLFFLLAGTLQAKPQKVHLNTLPSNVSLFQLDNGMQVLLIENPALPMVGVNVVVKVGSAYETFSTSGMSHMLEHLLFNGTTHRTQKQLYDDVDRIGGYNNANTAEYFTNFMMVTPAENIRQGMEIQADMLFHSTLPAKKFEKEKGIVLEEISKTLADPQSQAERNVISVLFKGHALSLPTLGTYATIKAMKCEDVYAFYKNNYVPNNMLLSVIGNFDSARMLKMVDSIYGQEPPGVVNHPPVSDWSLGFETTHLQLPQPGEVFHRFYGGKNPLLQLFFRVKGKHSPVFFELLDKKLADLSQDLRMQLGKQVRRVSLETRTTPVANFIQATIMLPPGTSHFDSIYTRVTQALYNASFAYQPNQLQAEAARARTSFLKNIEKPHMFGIFNAYEIAVNGFEAVLASYDSAPYFKAGKALAAFRVQGPPVTLIQWPEKQSNGQQATKKIVTKLFPGQNGLPALIVRQNPASHLVAIHYLLKHKAPLESKYGKNAAKILHDCFGQRLKEVLKKQKENSFGLEFKVNDNPYFPMDDIYLHPDFGYIRVEALDNDIPGLIHFLNEQMKNFTPTKEEFQKAQVKFGRSNPMMGGNPAKKLFKKLYKEQILEESPYPENSSPITYEKLLQFAQEYFTPANMIISVISPARPEAVSKSFAEFKGQPWTNEPAPYSPTLKLHNKPVSIQRESGGGRAYLFWGFTEAIEPKDAPALKALSLILSDKIVFDIREKQGMAYHLSAGIDIKNDRALFYIEQGTRPQNVDKLLPQYPKFFSPKILDDITEGDLQKSVNMYLGRMMFRRLSSINQAYYLGTSYYFHGDINYDHNFLQALKNVRLDDVRLVAQKYLHVKNPVQVIVR